MAENKHTPTPWFANNCTIQHLDTRRDIAKCYGDSIELSIEEEQANAAYIVHCVNTHDELVEALEAAKYAIRNYTTDTSQVLEKIESALQKATN